MNTVPNALDELSRDVPTRNGLAKEFARMRARLDALEAAFARSQTDTCPRCKVPAFRFTARLLKGDLMRCSNCGLETQRSFLDSQH